MYSLLNEIRYSKYHHSIIYKQLNSSSLLLWEDEEWTKLTRSSCVNSTVAIVTIYNVTTAKAHTMFTADPLLNSSGEAFLVTILGIVKHSLGDDREISLRDDRESYKPPLENLIAALQGRLAWDVSQSLDKSAQTSWQWQSRYCA